MNTTQVQQNYRHGDSVHHEIATGFRSVGFVVEYEDDFLNPIGEEVSEIFAGFTGSGWEKMVSLLFALDTLEAHLGGISIEKAGGGKAEAKNSYRFRITHPMETLKVGFAERNEKKKARVRAWYAANKDRRKAYYQKKKASKAKQP